MYTGQSLVDQYDLEPCFIVDALVFGMSSMYGGRLNENGCEMKVYSALPVKLTRLYLSLRQNRKLYDALVGFVELDAISV